MLNPALQARRTHLRRPLGSVPKAVVMMRVLINQVVKQRETLLTVLVYD